MVLPSEIAVLRVRRDPHRRATPPGPCARARLLTSLEVDDGAALRGALQRSAAARYVVFAAEEDGDGHVLEGVRCLEANPSADVVWFDTVIERQDPRGLVFEPWPAPDHASVRRELLLGAPLPLGALVLRREVAERVTSAPMISNFRAPGAHRAALLLALARGGRAVRGPGWAHVGFGDGAGAWRPAPWSDDEALVAAAFEAVRDTGGGDLDPFEQTLLGQPWTRHEVAEIRDVEHDLCEIVAVLADGTRVPLDGPDLAVALRLRRHQSVLSGVSLDTIRRTLWFEFEWLRERLPLLTRSLQSMIDRGIVFPSRGHE